MNKAEASYAGAVSQARSKLIQCLGQREAGAAAASPTLAALRKETGNKTLIPYEILAPTQAAFESINKTLAKTRIRIEAVDGAQCNQVASRIDGCWFDVSNKTDDFKGEPVTIRTGGGEATLTYTKSGRRFSGTAKGGRIDITYAIKSAAELADPHWWAGNQPPPGPVVRQAYTRYKIARKQISFSASAPDKLTGKHHGAYVRWGKTDKKMSSFETREYPARFLRGDKPKLRSIAFIDAGGKRRGSQSLSDSFRISAKGVSGCKAIVDTVRIKAYLDDDKDKFVWAQLRETGKDTLQFEGTISRLPALTSGRAQGSIRQVVVFDPVGLRGAAIKIVP